MFSVFYYSTNCRNSIGSLRWSIVSNGASDKLFRGCVIGCSGCRADANEAAIILLPSNVTVFTLDFSGSGLSGGDYVSLGWNEVAFLPLYFSLTDGYMP